MQTNFRSIVLATAALAVAALTVQAAHAESTRINIPFSFVAEGKNLPADVYVVERNANTNLLALHARSTGKSILLVVSPIGEGRKDVSLRFNERNNTHVLDSVQYGNLISSKLDKARAREDVSPQVVVVP